MTWLDDSIVQMVSGTLISSVVSWLCSWVYYRKSGKELAAEAQQLRVLNETMIRGFENAGLMRVVRDSKGKTIGLHVEVKIQDNVAVASSNAVGAVINS